MDFFSREEGIARADANGAEIRRLTVSNVFRDGVCMMMLERV